MKKIFSFLVLIALLLGLTFGSLFGATRVTTANAAEADSGNVIDMYLIAGQSNAVGYSSKGSLNETFSNIGYAGAVDYRLASGIYGANNSTEYSQFKWSITAGLGKNSGCIGPEYGMAKVFKERIGDTKAFIFKSAAGGTALRDANWGESATYGNWYPRSLWQQGYTPCKDKSTPTGVQYYLFVENFKNVYSQLKANGYKPVVKGMVWMQGCADLGAAAEYETLIRAFITDIRGDLSEITGANLSQMPFIIGKIATTFGNYGNSNVPAFNEMQQRVADSMKNVATIESSDLIIVNKDGTINGTDRYHFNTQDAVTLGERFGEKLMEYAKYSAITVHPVQNGSVEYEYDENSNLTFAFTANRNYKLQTVLLNGKDVTGDVSDGRLVLENAPSEISITAIFSELQKYNFTYDDLSEYGGSYINKAFYCYEGNKLKVKVKLPEGYEILFVKLGENELTLNTESGYYEIIPTAGGHIGVAVKKNGGDTSSVDSGKTDSSNAQGGCGSLLNGTRFTVCLAMATLFFINKAISRRRKNESS